ncbi:MAG: hypothetical protein R3E44_10485 [Paracoccaceae bacterium]
MSALPIETWIRSQTINADGSVVVRLTDAKARIPTTSFVSGTAPDPSAPPPGKSPIKITWPDGVQTLHFVRDDTNKYMIADRTDASKFHLRPFLKHSEQEIAITAIEDGEFLISLLPEK